MSLSSVFADAFLDGFTMSGFLRRATRPRVATQLLATPPVASDAYLDSAKRDSIDRHIEEWIRETYGIRTVPEAELNTMLVVLKRKGEERKLAALAYKDEVHGATR